MSGSRVVDFNALPRGVRERLIGCLGGEARTKPILSDVPAQSGAAGWILLANASAFGFYLTAGPDFGHSLQGQGMAIGYALWLALFVVSLLHIARRASLRRALPFKPGRYLLPFAFLDARTRNLRLLSLDLLAEASAEHESPEGEYRSSTVTLRFLDDTRESFTVRDRGLAERALRTLGESQAGNRDPEEGRGADALRAVDLFPGRTGDAERERAAPREIEGPAARSPSILFSRPVIVALSLAVALGLALPLLSLRNDWSDDAMFTEAVEAGTEGELERYLAGGRKHAEEVRTSLLPKAALRAAENVNTVSAFREFFTRYPGSTAEARARKSVHQLYTTTLARFREQAATSDPRLLPFMGKLLSHLESHDNGNVEVRFHIPSSGTLRLVDSLLQRRAQSDPTIKNLIPVAPHFDEAHSLSREASIVGNLKAGFAAVFPSDVMTIVRGKRIEVDSAPPAAPSGEPGSAPAPRSVAALGDITVPTIEVQYRISGGEDLYSEVTGNRQFVGIVVHFDVTMRIPGEPDVLDFALDVAPPSSFLVQYTAPRRREHGDLEPVDDLLRQGSRGGPTEGRVYDEMAARAFAQLTKKLREVLFRPDSDAARVLLNPDDPPAVPPPAPR